MRRETQSGLTSKHCDHDRCQATMGLYIVSGGESEKYACFLHLSEIVDKVLRFAPLRSATVKKALPAMANAGSIA